MTGDEGIGRNLCGLGHVIRRVLMDDGRTWHTIIVCRDVLSGGHLARGGCLGRLVRVKGLPGIAGLLD